MYMYCVHVLYLILSVYMYADYLAKGHLSRFNTRSLERCMLMFLSTQHSSATLYKNCFVYTYVQNYHGKRQRETILISATITVMFRRST